MVLLDGGRDGRHDNVHDDPRGLPWFPARHCPCVPRRVLCRKCHISRCWRRSTCYGDLQVEELREGEKERKGKESIEIEDSKEDKEKKKRMVVEEEEEEEEEEKEEEKENGGKRRRGYR
ncbi:hypothetical protein E2C01_032923 [Portunus trituberculatus]|uniref:Uncharacterized protein n=1 Tax=Portunus trituberculatus TaxID=210409 RepID=A0A5B7F2I9_PORTR|nr:hypothetical protein [Portunus trituberculatus]